MGSEPPKLHGSPNFFLITYLLSVFLCLLYAEKINLLLVNQQKNSQLKEGFEELKKKVNKIWLKRYLVITKYFGGSDPANMLLISIFTNSLINEIK